MNSLAAKVRFEPLREAHIPQILAIEKLVNTAPWSDRSFRNELTNPHGIFLVVMLDNRIVGYGGCWLVIDEAHITSVAIDEEYRRYGIGERLMNELLAKAKEKGMVCSTLEVRASNVGAINLYEKLGYKITAQRKRYYPENKEDAMVMWLYDLQDWEPPA